MEGSWDTWHGRTMLSPTVTSILEGGMVITVLSVEKKYYYDKKLLKLDIWQQNTYFTWFCNCLKLYNYNLEFYYIQHE